MRSEANSTSQCQTGGDTTTTRKSERADSPLDFSTKKKFKPEPLLLERERLKLEGLEEENPESPCSRLRNILSMKSPLLSEDVGTVLNLSKESPLSTLWCPKVESNNSSTSNSSSPPLSENPGHIKSNSPRSATIPLLGNTPLVIPPVLVGGMGQGEGDVGPLLPPWGSGVYSPSISPLLNQTVPANGTQLPLSFETSPTLFPHIGAGAASPSLPFSSLSLPMAGSGPGHKGRVTRPFKAYPKDPLSFSSVGLYGLPLGTAPGTTEAVIHQQSNHAYAEFRKQMLSSSQFGKCRRGATHRTSPYPTMDSIHSLDEQILAEAETASIMRANDSGSASDDGNSVNGKNRMGKTEQQMKDEAYWERRRKNNEAAKRSRDARRAKEDEIAIRAAFLEQENLKLRFEVCALKNETAKLRCMLYSS